MIDVNNMEESGGALSREAKAGLYSSAQGTRPLFNL